MIRRLVLALGLFLAAPLAAQTISVDDVAGLPTGPAGGSLSGSYPNPAIASGAAIASPALSGTVTGANTIPLLILAQSATNTVLGNSTNATANVTALAVGTCSTSSSALIWTTNTGFGCNTSINAATLGGSATFAAPGAIGGGTPSTAAFTTISATGQITSTLATGTAPFVIASTTNVANLNASSLSGATFASPGAIGGTAASTIAATGITITASNVNTNISPTGTSTVTLGPPAGQLVLANISTGTPADFLCVTSGNVVLLQATACLVSSKQFKDDLGPLDISATKALSALMPVQFTMKPRENPNADWNYDQPQIGLYAEDVAAVDRRLAIFEQDGQTPKSYRQEAIIALLVKGFQEQEARLAQLESRAR